MALLGGGVGGAGNPVGGSFTGPAEALEYTGLENNHIYAYSGFVDAITGGTTALDFQTGSKSTYATLHYTGVIAKTNPAAGQRGNALVSMNGTDITSVFVDVNDIGGVNSIDLIIPPYTEVKVILYADSSSGNTHACHLTGIVV